MPEDKAPSNAAATTVLMAAIISGAEDSSRRSGERSKRAGDIVSGSELSSGLS